MFPCFTEKPAFGTRDPQIDKINLFLLSGRVVFRCRRKSLQENWVPTDRKNNFQILITFENKLFKAELQKLGSVKKTTVSNYLFTF